MRRDCVSPRSKCPIIGRLNGTTVSNLDGTTTSRFMSYRTIVSMRYRERMRETERGKRKRIVSRWSHGVNVARMILSLNPLPPLARRQGERERGKEKEVVNAGSIGFTTPLFSCISRMTTCYTLHTANY